MNIVIYNSKSGKIRANVTCSENQVALQLAEEELFIPGISQDATQMVVGGELVARPKLTLSVSKATISANGVDEAVIGGVPAGSKLYLMVAPQIEAIADGRDIHLTFTKPGSYDLLIHTFPCQNEKVVIHAI